MTLLRALLCYLLPKGLSVEPDAAAAPVVLPRLLQESNGIDRRSRASPPSVSSSSTRTEETHSSIRPIAANMWLKTSICSPPDLPIAPDSTQSKPHSRQAEPESPVSQPKAQEGLA